MLAEIDSLRGWAVTGTIELTVRVAQRYAVWVGTFNGSSGVPVARFIRAYAPFCEVIESALVGALPCQLDEKRFCDLNQAALPHYLHRCPLPRRGHPSWPAFAPVYLPPSPRLL